MKQIFLTATTPPPSVISLQAKPSSLQTNLDGIKAWSILLQSTPLPTIDLTLADNDETIHNGTLTAVDCQRGVIHVRDFKAPIGKYSAALIRLNDVNQLDVNASSACFDLLLQHALQSDTTTAPPSTPTSPSLPPTSSSSSPLPSSTSTSTSTSPTPTKDTKSFARDAEVRKYWSQRYHLFSLFDAIQTDREGLFSATPECVAQHVARRVNGVSNKVVWDAFAGVGGNCCHFKSFEKIIATDLNENRLEMCRNNCRVYGIKHVEFMVGNFLELCGSIRANVVVLSPPWGGPKYLDVHDETALQLENIISVPCDGVKLFQLGHEATQPKGIIVYMLPKNVNKDSVLALGEAFEGTMEIEDMFVNGVLKMTVAYFQKD